MRGSNSKLPYLLLFLLGLGSATKIVFIGVISFSELAMFVVAPYLWVKHSNRLSKLGLLPIAWMVLFLICGLGVSCWYYGYTVFYFVKMAALYYSIFADATVFAHLFSTGNGFRAAGWYMLGSFISGLISIFAFNPQVSTSMEGSTTLEQRSVDEVMGGVMFWFSKVKALIAVFVVMFYFKFPIWLSSLATAGGAIFAAMSSVSGRGAAAFSLLTVALFYVGQKSRLRMKRIGKYFFVFILGGFCLAVLLKNAYVYTASRGILGEKALGKYESQIHGNDSLLGVLIGGRVEFFVAIRAALDAPFVGIGDHVIDTKGYMVDILNRYGNEQDFASYERACYLNGGFTYIPQHSCITQFWAVSGIAGLIFWLYVLGLIFLHYKKYVSAVPQLFCMISIMTPGIVFSIFFNPFARGTHALLIALILISRAVGQHKINLPPYIEVEAQKYDR